MNHDLLKRFAMPPSERGALSPEFHRILQGVVFGPTAATSGVPDESGCYFWVVRDGEHLFKLYLGRTRSLRRRMTEYMSEFQVHSPNDYKLRFFQERIATEWPSAELDLHFMPIGEHLVKAKETELVQRFRPLVNTLPPANAAERLGVKRAFEAYYRATTDRYLAPDA